MDSVEYIMNGQISSETLEKPNNYSSSSQKHPDSDKELNISSTDENIEEKSVEPTEPLYKTVISLTIRCFVAALVSTVSTQALRSIKPYFIEPYNPRKPVKRGKYNMARYWNAICSVATGAGVILFDYIIFGVTGKPNGRKKMSKKNAVKNYIQNSQNRSKMKQGPKKSNVSVTDSYYAHVGQIARQKGVDLAVAAIFSHFSQKFTPAEASPIDCPLFSVEQMSEYFNSLPIMSSAVKYLVSVLPPHPSRLLSLSTLQEQFSKHRDRPFVYLGGSTNTNTNTSNWREIVMEMLDRNEVAYYNPSTNTNTNIDTNTNSSELLAVETLMKNWCPAILYVIDSETRSIASMVEAAALCAEGRRMVLYVEAVSFEGNNMNKEEIQELNRGRQYLLDVAAQHRICVREDLSEAVDVMVDMCFKYYNNKKD